MIEKPPQGGFFVCFILLEWIHTYFYKKK